MGRIIKADTIRLDDYVNIDNSDPSSAHRYGRRGYVDSIIHSSHSTIDLVLVDAGEWPIPRAEVRPHDLRYITLNISNSPAGSDVVWRR